MLFRQRVHRLTVYTLFEDTSITQWKTQLLDRAAQLFGAGTGQAEKPVDMKVLHAKIGELALENDFLEAALTKAGLPGARR